jgi:hypothetical protein
MSTLPKDNEYIVWPNDCTQCTVLHLINFWLLQTFWPHESLEFFAANFCHQSPKTESNPLQILKGKKRFLKKVTTVF